MLIINADDFGLNSSVNSAIVYSFERGFCSSTTIMANMPGFEAACELVHEYKLKNHVGIHLVLTEGYPLTEKIKKIPRFCDKEGCFYLSRVRRLVRLSTVEKEAVAEETKAQITRCREHRIPIKHLDSHSHVHEEWGVASVLIPVMREERIPYVRLSRNFGSGISMMKRCYKGILNARFLRAGLAKTQYFGTPDDYRLYVEKLVHQKTLPISWEIMTHPILDKQQRLMDSWLKRPLDSVITTLYGYEKAVSFGGHRYRNKLT